MQIIKACALNTNKKPEINLQENYYLKKTHGKKITRVNSQMLKKLNVLNKLAHTIKKFNVKK